MRRWITLTCLAASALFAGLPASAAAAADAPQTLVIGVDHVDAANQQPVEPFDRFFEYTDFFSREVTVHTGDTIDFQAAAGSGHVVALASSEEVARRVYPVVFADVDDGVPDIATGSGTAKVVFGPSEFPILGGSTGGGGTVFHNNAYGPPVCGLTIIGQPNCRFRGADDIEVIGPTPGFNFLGQPFTLDQFVTIDAAPGTYAYFCTIHPGMRGVLNVAPPGLPRTTQAQIDLASQAQFERDRAQALQVESLLNRDVAFGPPGHRTHLVQMGAEAAQHHVSIDEILPNRPMAVTPGDTVLYVWGDSHNTHNVVMPAEDPRSPHALGFDCGSSPPGFVGLGPTFGRPPAATCLEPGATEPEIIGDPGNAPPGTLLTSPAQFLDSGVLVGIGFRAHPSSQLWWITTSAASAPGDYSFQCEIHDWMQGSLHLGS